MMLSFLVVILCQVKPVLKKLLKKTCQVSGGGNYPFWDTGYQGEIAVGIRDTG